jgi:hypothetical protein
MRMNRVALLAGVAALATGCASSGSGSGAPQPLVLQTEHFAVAPGEEKTLCQVIHAKNAPMDFNHISSRMVDGSHHLILFRHAALPGYPTPEEGLQDCNMGAPRLYVYGAQEAVHETVLPEGIGGRLQADEIFILEVHIANASGQTLDAFATVSISPAPADSIEQYSGVLFYMNNDFSIPAGAGVGGAPVHTDGTVCSVPRDVNVFRMQSHTHQRMTRVNTWLTDLDGNDEQAIYKNEDWHSPVTRDFNDPALAVARGKSIRFECSWSNETENAIEFGESVEDEMCIVGLGYYPAIEFNDGDEHTIPIDTHGTVFCVDGQLYY